MQVSATNPMEQCKDNLKVPVNNFLVYLDMFLFLYTCTLYHNNLFGQEIFLPVIWLPTLQDVINFVFIFFFSLLNRLCLP